MKAILRKLYEKLEKKFHLKNNFKIFHLLDIGKINGNLIFSLINIYYAPQAAPWVLIGIGYEASNRPNDVKDGIVLSIIRGYIVLTIIGKQKRIPLYEKNKNVKSK